MRHFGNVVPLPERHAAAPRRVPSYRRVDPCSLSPIERTYCTVPFTSMVVAEGVMHGETLEMYSDFVVGDTFAIDDRDGQLAANDHIHAPLPANAVKADSPTIKALADWADVLRMTLLDETGCGHLGYAVTPNHRGMRASYVLLPRALPAKRKLTLIDAVLI